MVVWIQNPFDNLPSEGFRKMRYALMAEAFVRQGHSVVLWTSDFSHALKRPRTCGPMPYEVRLVPTVPYAANVSLRRILSHRLYALKWERLARAEPVRPDLIVSSLPSISGAAAALRLGRSFGAKVVIDVQDAWPETFERILPRYALAPLRLKTRWIYRAADLVTGVCERYRALTGRSDYYRAYLGIEPGEAPTPRTPDPSRPRIAYVGGLGRTYDLATAEAAAAALRGELRIAGGSNYLDAAELPRFLSECDVGLIPMTAASWVGLPNKLFDYARAGLPIVSSLEGETAALLSDWNCGVTYRAGDVGSLTAAIRAALTLPRDASRRLCAREFDARTIYDAYVNRVVDLV